MCRLARDIWKTAALTLRVDKLLASNIQSWMAGCLDALPSIEVWVWTVTLWKIWYRWNRLVHEAEWLADSVLQRQVQDFIHHITTAPTDHTIPQELTLAQHQPFHLKFVAVGNEDSGKKFSC